MKAFYKQRILQPGCVRKETVNSNILVKPKNDDHVIYHNYNQTSVENKGIEPVELVQMNVYQSNTEEKNEAGHISTMSKGFQRYST